MKISFSPPDITEFEIEEVTDTLKSGWITTGPKTKRFEQEIAAFCGTQRAVCLNSATACLEMALRLLGIGKGDEVITSAYTYTASASVIVHVGATPVLVDVAKDSFEMDYEKLKGAINSKTRAIIPVDIGGVLCDYDRIYRIVEEKKAEFVPNSEQQRVFGRIAVVADAAHSFGSVRKGIKSGQAADFTSFSFHAVKNLTTGEGGALTWKEHPGLDSEKMYKQLMLYSLHGQSKDALEKTKLGAWEYDIVAPYYKCNMTDICASVGIAQLKRYPSLLQKRRELIGIYDIALKDQPVTVLHHSGEDYQSNGHLYLVRLNGGKAEFRNKVIEEMARKGIATNVHYKPLPMHTAYKSLGFSIEDYPNSFAQYENEITLPLHTLMTPEQAEFVARSLIECIHQV